MQTMISIRHVNLLILVIIHCSQCIIARSETNMGIIKPSFVVSLRGGYQDYDDYDEYDAYSPPPRPRPRPHSRTSSKHRHRPPSRHQQKSASFDALQQAQDIAKKTLSIASNTAMGTIKTSGKAAYYLTAPKFVSKPEIYGIWRLDQTVGSTPCAANIEFTPTEVITRYLEEEVVYGYLFQSRTWPRSCTIEFEAEAFQGPGDEKPVKFMYKGYFRRKLADKSVIKIVGKIYEIRKRFGKSVRGEEIGSFVARRRISKPMDGDEYDEYDDDDYEEYDEEDNVHDDNDEEDEYDEYN